MGLFEWLTGKKDRVEISEDRIWLTKQAKIDGIQQEIRESLADASGPDALIVVAHFRDHLDEFESVIESVGFDRQRVLVTLAESLQGHRHLGVGLDESRLVQFVVAERHPLPSHDETVVEFARSLSCRCRIVYYVSLEDPLTRVFSGEWVENILRRLGMKEDEAIQSRMVVRRIRAAQQKIESRATGDRPDGENDRAEAMLECAAAGGDRGNAEGQREAGTTASA